jgi:hypothetical protein
MHTDVSEVLTAFIISEIRLNFEAVSTSESSEYFCETTWRNINLEPFSPK